MRIGFDANPMVGDMGGVGWHSYHLLRTMLAQQEGIDFVAYAKPGAEQPDSVKAWPGVERLQWMNSSRWGMRKRGSSDRLDLYHGTNFRMQTVGRYGGVVTIHDLWMDRHPRILEEDVGTMAIVVQDETDRATSQKSHHGVRVFRQRTRGTLWFETRAHQGDSQWSVGGFCATSG